MLSVVSAPSASRARHRCSFPLLTSGRRHLGARSEGDQPATWLLQVTDEEVAELEVSSIMQSAPAAGGLPPAEARAAGAAAGMDLPAQDRDLQRLMPAAEQPEAAVGSKAGAAGTVGGEFDDSDGDEGSVLGDSESGISSDSDDGGGGPGLSGFQDVLSSWAQAAALPKPSARRGKPSKPAAVGPAAAELDAGAAPVKGDTPAALSQADVSAGAQPAERRLQASSAASGSRHSQPSSGSSVASWLADASLVGRDRGAQQPSGLPGQPSMAAAAAAMPDWLADSGSDDEQEPQWRPSAGITVRADILLEAVFRQQTRPFCHAPLDLVLSNAEWTVINTYYLGLHQEAPNTPSQQPGMLLAISSSEASASAAPSQVFASQASVSSASPPRSASLPPRPDGGAGRYQSPSLQTVSAPAAAMGALIEQQQRQHPRPPPLHQQQPQHSGGAGFLGFSAAGGVGGASSAMGQALPPWASPGALGGNPLQARPPVSLRRSSGSADSTPRAASMGMPFQAQQPQQFLSLSHSAGLPPAHPAAGFQAAADPQLPPSLAPHPFALHASSATDWQQLQQPPAPQEAAGARHNKQQLACRPCVGVAAASHKSAQAPGVAICPAWVLVY